MLSDTQRTRGDAWRRLCSSDDFHACISVGRRLSDDTERRDSASFVDDVSGDSRGMRCKNSWSEYDANSATSSDASWSAYVEDSGRRDIIERSHEGRGEAGQRPSEGAEVAAEKVTTVLLAQRRSVLALQVAVKRALHDLQQTGDGLARHRNLRVARCEGSVFLRRVRSEVEVAEQHAQRHRRQNRSELVRRLETAETGVQQPVQRIGVLGHLRLRGSIAPRPR